MTDTFSPSSSFVEHEASYSPSSEAYKNFINSIDSEATKTMYKYALSLFMQFCGLKGRVGRGDGGSSDDGEGYEGDDNDDNYYAMSAGAMLQLDKQKLEDKIRDYITFLRVDKKLSSNTQCVHSSDSAFLLHEQCRLKLEASI